MRKPVVIANWKMNMTIASGLSFIWELEREVKGFLGGVEFYLCVPYTLMYPLGRALQDKPIYLGAQNMHWELMGPYTGEISPLLLMDVGCKCVMIGHSERRQHFCETDETVKKKTRAALRQKLIPIICVGENLEEKEKGFTKRVVGRQIRRALAGIEAKDVGRIVFLYEPVWAIGAKEAASAVHADEVHHFIRALLASKYGDSVAEQVRIAYGGSADPQNARKLLSKKDIDGLGAGRKGMDVRSFSEIAKAVHRYKVVGGEERERQAI